MSKIGFELSKLKTFYFYYTVNTVHREQADLYLVYLQSGRGSVKRHGDQLGSHASLTRKQNSTETEILMTRQCKNRSFVAPLPSYPSSSRC